jgi:hypothetical protein
MAPCIMLSCAYSAHMTPHMKMLPLMQDAQQSGLPIRLMAGKSLSGPNVLPSAAAAREGGGGNGAGARSTSTHR